RRFPMNRIAWQAVTVAVIVAGCKTPEFQTANRPESNGRDDDRRGSSNLAADRMGRNPLRGSQQTRPILARAVRDENAGRLAEAQAGYEDVLKMDRGNATAHHRLAVIADKTGNYHVAAAHYAAALRVKRRDANLLNDYGLSLKLQKRFDEAEQYFKQALAIDPNHTNATNNLNALYAQRDADVRLRNTASRDDRSRYPSSENSLRAPSPNARGRDARLATRWGNRRLSPDADLTQTRRDADRYRARRDADGRDRDSGLYGRRGERTISDANRYTQFGPDRRSAVSDRRPNRDVSDFERGSTRRAGDRYIGSSRSDSSDRSNDNRFDSSQRPIPPSANDPLEFPPRRHRAIDASYSTQETARRPNPGPRSRSAGDRSPDYRRDGSTAAAAREPSPEQRAALRYGHNAGVGGAPFPMPPGGTRDTDATPGFRDRQPPAELPPAYDGPRGDRTSPYDDRSADQPRRARRNDDFGARRDDREPRNSGFGDRPPARRYDGPSIRPLTKQRTASAPVPGQWNLGSGSR
ncbi:MAG: tetratricopeptide repeat protein, partial [Planctomycetaceae bacterium]